MKARISRHTLIVVVVALGGFAPAAFAYLDPSTGSMILSAIVGIFATLVLGLKTYWYKLKTFFKGNSPAAAEVTSTEAGADPDKEAE